MRVGALAANVDRLCVPRSSRSSSCSPWPPPPVPLRSPMSTVARSGCRHSTGRRRSASRLTWSTAPGKRRSGSPWRPPTAAGSSLRAISPGRISRFSSFKVWEPNGTSTVEGPLNAPSGWTSYVYPLGFDVTADGVHMVYGYSNSSSCCPISFAHGTYVRPVTNSSLDPINVSGQEHPTLFGNRMIAHSGEIASVQGDPSPLRDDLLPLARRLGDRTRAPPHRRRRERPARGNRAGAVGRRRADGRQDRGGGDPGRRPAARVPRRRGLLSTDDRGRQGRVAFTRRDTHRLDRRRRPEGGGSADDRRRPVRPDLAAGRDLARLPRRARSAERTSRPSCPRPARGPARARASRPASAERRWPRCREGSPPRPWPGPRASRSRSRSLAPAR